MKHPWMKFYPQDWRADARLRAVSIGARGLWMEMLCLMHEAKPYGHLLLNGQPVTNNQLAALAGTSPDTVLILLDELEGSGVFSRNRSGVIFSRRMRRDFALSSKQRANVEKRWAKSRNSTPAQDIEIAQENVGGNTKPIPPPLPKKPEARSQNVSSSKEKETHKARAPDRPADVPYDVWRDFLTIRRAKRAPLTATALAGIEREAGKAGWALSDALAECVTRGWQGFKADWVAGAGPPPEHSGVPL